MSSSRAGSPLRRRRSSHFSPMSSDDGVARRRGKVDARAGGTLRVIMPDAAAASGYFIEVVPPRRVVSPGDGYDL